MPQGGVDNPMLPYCVNCSALVANYNDLFRDPVCPKCYRDPMTNSCQVCSSHVEGVNHVYTCWNCAKPALIQKAMQEEEVSSCNCGCGAPAEADGVCRMCRGHDYGRDL